MKERENEAKWDEKNKRWRITVQRDGVRRQFYSSTPKKKGKAEAERKADEWIKHGDPERDMTFDELSASYLDHLRTANGTAHKRREGEIIRLYLPWQGKKVSRLTNLDYQEAIDACVEGRKKPLSARTCGHVRSTIMALYKHARKAGVTMTEPFDLTIPAGATKGKRKILQPDDLKKLFAAEGHYIPVFQFIALTGLRPGEVCGLKWTDLDGDFLTISRARNRAGEITTGKNENARRRLKLPLAAKSCLLPNDSEWIFTNTLGSPLDEQTLYKAWVRLTYALGLPAVSLYELRHTMISMVKDDLPLPMLKQVVGHSGSMDTLGVYGHEVDGEMDTAAAVIEDKFRELLAEDRAKNVP